MFKTVGKRVWAFDAEWVPDPAAGRMLYQLAQDVPDEQVLQVMWKEGGATEEDPTPYLKTVLCRIVSVAAVDRQELRIHWIPRRCLLGLIRSRAR